jgi:hypothetical protein
LEKENLTSALQDGVLTVTGVRLWNALHSESWRNREAAAKAFATFINTDPLPKYRPAEGQLSLFKASILIAKVSCLDKLL